MTWQPIETAPRDGTRVLVRVNAPHWLHVEVAFWHDTAWVCDVVQTGGRRAGRQSIWSLVAPQPTHWQPLPSTELEDT